MGTKEKIIEICKGHNCQENGSGKLKTYLEQVCQGIDYKIIPRNCSGHCSKGPIVKIGDDLYSGKSDLFQQDEEKFRTFLRNYQSVTSIEGYCNNAAHRNVGLAIDLGTTTIKAGLNDLGNGDVMGEISTMNKQRAYGATVLHRWNYFNKAKDREDKLETLSAVVQKIVNDIKDYFLEHSKGSISETVFAGNTAMTYFFLKEDPGLTLERKPEYRTLKQSNGMTLLPCIFEWVGGDIVSGMTFLDFDSFDNNKMLIDLGTNGEVALSTKQEIILVAAASAGPAFEGEGFRCGMPAMKGAIYEVDFESGQFTYKVTGQDEPLGLCGSGMLDLIAELFKQEIMDFNGNLKDGKEFFLTDTISVKQEEIDYFKNSKAAIFATIQTLLKEANISYHDLDVIYVAGGFGNMDLAKAQLIGLLPPSDNYQYMGNTSLQGAQKCLKKEYLEQAKKIAHSATPLLLTESTIFMDQYEKARFFPHTDIKLFEHVLTKHMKQ